MRLPRRNFLLGSTATAAAAGLGLFTGIRAARAQLPSSWSRKAVNVVLNGGPDFRHLIVPPPNNDPASYGYSYWKYRSSAHQISDSNVSQWNNRYANDYLHVTQINGVAVPEFGVLGRCGWLYDEIVAGRVAIVSNVEHSTNRDHAHSLLILQAGDLETRASAATRDGWGGRLAAHLDGNVFSLTRQKLLFCNLPSATGTSQIVSARNTRAFGLARSTPEDYQEGGEAVSDRALSSYYQALRTSNTVAQSSPYYKFVHHEDVLRGFTNAVAARLATDVNPIPEEIAALYSGDPPALTRNRNFGEQMRNLWDCLACEDLTDTYGSPFGFRVGSLEYGGWDSHRDQRNSIEPQFEDIFGAGKGLASLYSAIDATMPGARNAFAITIAGEFGRQLRSNGDRGTDHGRGNYVFVIGGNVRGGVYGELFPQEEVTTLVDNRNKFERYNQDIEGKTALSHVFGAVCDWVANDDTAGDEIFPSRATDIMEAGTTVTRASLFTT